MPVITHRVSRVVAAAALAAAFAGPWASVVRAQPTPCPGASCDVIVTVTGGPAAPVVAVSANELKMAKRQRNVVITWKLEAPDYEFRADSITAHTAPPSGAKLTTTSEAWRDQCTTLNHSATAYRIRNSNTKAGPLFYNVKVFHKATGTPVVLDPSIVNDP
ncbi:MAG: hypothetical protein U1F58_15385 [Burkholderiales bacterium]